MAKKREKLECESNPFLGAMFPDRDCGDDTDFLEETNADVNVITSNEDIIKALEREMEKYKGGEKYKNTNKLVEELHTSYPRLKELGENLFGKELFQRVFLKYIPSKREIIEALEREMEKYERGEEYKGVSKLAEELHSTCKRMKEIGEDLFGKNRYKQIFGRRTDIELIEALEREMEKCERGEEYKGVSKLAEELRTSDARMKRIGEDLFGKKRYKQAFGRKGRTDIELIEALEREMEKCERGEEYKGVSKLAEELQVHRQRLKKIGVKYFGEKRYRQMKKKGCMTDIELIEALKREEEKYNNGKEYKGTGILKYELHTTPSRLRNLGEEYFGKERYYQIFGVRDDSIKNISNATHIAIEYFSLRVFILNRCKAVHEDPAGNGIPDLIIERNKNFRENIEKFQSVIHIPRQIEKIAVDFTLSLQNRIITKKFLRKYHNYERFLLIVLMRESKEFTARKLQKNLDNSNNNLDYKEHIRIINFEQYLEFLNLGDNIILSSKAKKILTNFRNTIKLTLDVINKKDGSWEKLVKLAKICVELLDGNTPREKKVLSLSID